MTHIDEWVPVQGFPGYSINPLGQVRRDASERLLQPRFNQYGVPYVGLMREWKQCSRSLPRLVADTFVPNNKEIFDTPVQKDGDRTNCRFDNLMWRPRWYAVLYNQQFGAQYGNFDGRYANPIKVPVRAVNTDDVFPDSFSAACFYGLLEREVVLSILNQIFTWPTFQQFEIAES